MVNADIEKMNHWRYPPPYDVYDVTPSAEDVQAMLDPLGDTWFSADDAAYGDLAGFFEFGHQGRVVEIGLGLRPDLTGRGIGTSFVAAGMAFALSRWKLSAFAVDVLPWNARAMRAYEAAGFERGVTYVRRFDDGNEREFVRMSRPSDLSAPA